MVNGIIIVKMQVWKVNAGGWWKHWVQQNNNGL